MAKEKKVRVVKEKKETAPKLAAFVDSTFPIYLVMGKKERSAQVLSSGLIRFKDVDHKSPCSAAQAMAKDMDEKWEGPNAWSRLRFNKDGARVPLDTLRGSKSPLKAVEAKPKRVKKAKAARPTANGAVKPKRIRKPRGPKLPVAASETQQEATA